MCFFFRTSPSVFELKGFFVSKRFEEEGSDEEFEEIGEEGVGSTIGFRSCVAARAVDAAWAFGIEG